MTQIEFETRHKARLVCKADIWWARWLGRVWPSFLAVWWTTFRFPFQVPTIYYPPGIDPMAPWFSPVRGHELVHVKQQRSAWGLFKTYLCYTVFPLPIYFSGRWFIERSAYLYSIRIGDITVERAVDVLWSSYGRPWPRRRMETWFWKHGFGREGRGIYSGGED